LQGSCIRYTAFGDDSDTHPSYHEPYFEEEKKGPRMNQDPFLMDKSRKTEATSPHP